MNKIVGSFRLGAFICLSLYFIGVVLPSMDKA